MSTFEEVVRDMFWGQGSHACACMGPQNGEPLCPCAMRQVKIVDGHYIKVEDLGKVEDFSKDRDGFSSLIITACKNKVQLMKFLRERCNFSLSEAKLAADNLPYNVDDCLFSEEAEILKKNLETMGISAEVQ